MVRSQAPPTPPRSPPIAAHHASGVRRAAVAVLDPPDVAHRRALAVLAVTAAVGASVALASVASFSSYTLIVAAMIAVTWYAGMRAALAATALAAVVGWFFIAEPRYSATLEAHVFAHLALAMASAVSAVLLTEAMHRARQSSRDLAARRQQLLSDLAAREAWLRALTDSVPVLISYVDSERRYRFTNRTYEIWYGRDRDDINGRHIWEVIGQDAYDAIRPRVDEVLAGKRVSFEALLRYASAGTRWVHADLVPEFTDDGAVAGYFALVSDVSDRKEAVAQLSFSERRYRTLAESTASIVWVTAADGGMSAPQPAWEEYTGQAWPAYRDAGALDRVHPDDRAGVSACWRTAIAARAPMRAACRVWHAASGEWHHCDNVAVPLTRDSGEVIEWIGTTTDVEDRFQLTALEGLRAIDERTRLAETAARMGMWEWDQGTGFIWSEGLERLFGTKPEGTPAYAALLEHVHPADRPRMLRTFAAAARNHRDIDAEFRVDLPDGAIRWLAARASTIAATGEQPARTVGVTIDVTARKGAEEALRESEQRERFLSRVTQELIASFSQGDTEPDIARLAVPQLGDICAFGLFDPEPIAFSIAADCGGPRTRELARSVRLRDFRPHAGAAERIGDAIARGEAVRIARVDDAWLRACAPSGDQRELVRRIGAREAMVLPLLAGGRTIGVATFVLTRPERTYGEADFAQATEFARRTATIAENARLLAELRRTAEDLRFANAAKDEFLGLVSHELKTPITTIIGNADVLRRRIDRLDVATRTQALDDISTDAARLHRLIDNMLVLARLERGARIDLEPVPLAHIIERVAARYRARLPGRSIGLRTRDGDAVVLGSASYIEQVVNNLLSNAEKYSPDGAPIEVEVMRDGAEVCVDVLDRGAGILPEEAAHIFDTFYRSPRTAGGVAGIGVGLAVCKRVIEAQHGRIWAHPRPGGGAAFGFALPAAAG